MVHYHVLDCFTVEVTLVKSAHLIKYCVNPDKDCRKKILFSDFDGSENIESRGCRCCDVRMNGCSCKQCELNTRPFS